MQLRFFFWHVRVIFYPSVLVPPLKKEDRTNEKRHSATKNGYFYILLMVSKFADEDSSLKNQRQGQVVQVLSNKKLEEIIRRLVGYSG